MKKFIVETYYTCTFKTVHTLDELNDIELSKIDSRKDGEVLNLLLSQDTQPTFKLKIFRKIKMIKFLFLMDGLFLPVQP